MGSINIIQFPLTSAVDKPWQHKNNFLAESSESNPGPLGEKRKPYICAMQPPVPYLLLCTPLLNPGSCARCPFLIAYTFAEMHLLE